jgi:hypothetical protein
MFQRISPMVKAGKWGMPIAAGIVNILATEAFSTQ